MVNSINTHFRYVKVVSSFQDHTFRNTMILQYSVNISDGKNNIGAPKIQNNFNVILTFLGKFGTTGI